MLYKRLGVWIRLSLMAFAMSFLAAPAQAWFFGDDHPDEAEITRAVQKDLPQWIKIIDLDIGSQETRSGLMEHSESRVKVSMAPTEALYRRHLTEKNGTTLYRVAQEADKRMEGFLIARAVPSGEGWKVVEIDWDDQKFRNSFGRPESKLTGKALIRGSDAHKAYIEYQKVQFAKARSVYEVPHKGVLNCKGGIEVDDLQVNILERNGKIKYRTVDDVDYAWKEAEVSLKDTRDDYEYFMSSPAFYGSFHLTTENDKVKFRNHNCKLVSLMPAEEANALWADDRRKQQAFLDKLQPGPIASKAIEVDRLHETTAEILSVGERGFKVKVQHPIRLNGRVHSNGQLATTTMDVRFLDAPFTLRTMGKTEGRGGPIIASMCQKRAVFTPEDGLRIEAHTVYGCNETLILTP